MPSGGFGHFFVSLVWHEPDGLRVWFDSPSDVRAAPATDHLMASGQVCSGVRYTCPFGLMVFFVLLMSDCWLTRSPLFVFADEAGVDEDPATAVDAVDPPSSDWTLPRRFTSIPTGGIDVSQLRHDVRPNSTTTELGDDGLEPGVADITPDSTHGIGQRIVGRLGKFVAFWWFIGASAMIVKWITVGYDLPFISSPERGRWPNHPGSRQYAFFIDDALPELEQAGVISRWQEEKPPWLICPLNVVPKQGTNKFRLILDLRKLNVHLYEYKFSMETLVRRREMFKKDAFLFNLDLTSAYFHVPVIEAHRTYMGFEWQGQIWTFNCLPFGLKPAPFVFTRVSKCVAQFLRSRGVILIHYLDDFCFQAFDYSRCWELIRFVVTVFQSLGWLVNAAKSNLRPARILQHLGFVIDLTAFTFRLVPERVERLSKLVVSTLASARRGVAIPIKTLAKITGTLQSMALVLGNIVNTFCFFLYQRMDKVARVSWAGSTALSERIMTELELWVSFLAKSVLFAPIMSISKRAFCQLECDASDTHWAAVLVSMKGRSVLRVRGEFDEFQAGLSSTWREYYTFCRAISRIGYILRGLRVWFRTDSLSSYNIFRRGRSKREYIQNLVIWFYGLLRQFSIDASMNWWSRDLGIRADADSKYVERFDWSLRRDVLWRLLKLFGPFSVDLFASAGNAICVGEGVQKRQLPFCSRFYSPKSLGNALSTYVWLPSENYWCFPGFNDVEAAVRCFQAARARGVLIVPEWPDAVWWHLLVIQRKLRPGVKDMLRLGSFSSCVFDRATGEAVECNSAFVCVVFVLDFRSGGVPAS